MNGYDRKGARARVDITPDKDVDIVLIADYLRSSASPIFTPYKLTGTADTSAPFVAGIAPVVASAENRQVFTDIPSDIRDTNKGLSAQVDWRLGGHTLTSITAVREWDNAQYTSTSAIGTQAASIKVVSTAQLKSP